MALCEGVERLLEDEIRRFTIDRKQRDRSLRVAAAAEGGLHRLHCGTDAERIGFEPASLLEGGDELLAGADEHEICDIGWFVVFRKRTQGSRGDERGEF